MISEIDFFPLLTSSNPFLLEINHVKITDRVSNFLNFAKKTKFKKGLKYAEEREKYTCRMLDAYEKMKRQRATKIFNLRTRRKTRVRSCIIETHIL